jgi:prepilin-type processing-associated H-X9-DG protein
MNVIRVRGLSVNSPAPHTGAEPQLYHLRGFTIVELIAVVSILMVLAALLVPVGMNVRASAESATCVSQLRQIGLGLQLYMSEHGRRFPELAPGPSEADPEGRPALNTFLLEYAGGNPKVFACPSDSSIYPETGSSYQWNSSLNGLLIEEVEDAWRVLGLSLDQSQIPVIFDAEAFHKSADSSVNFLFADGSADQSSRFYVE